MLELSIREPEEHVTWPFWKCLSPKARAKLRQLMPEDWEPPRSYRKAISYDVELKDIDQIGKMMNQSPQYSDHMRAR